jgi:hypothetical protein
LGRLGCGRAGGKSETQHNAKGGTPHGCPGWVGRA